MPAALTPERIATIQAAIDRTDHGEHYVEVTTEELYTLTAGHQATPPELTAAANAIANTPTKRVSVRARDLRPCIPSRTPMAESGESS